MILRNIRLFGFGNDQDGQLANVQISNDGELNILSDVPTTLTTEKIDAQGEYALLPGWLDTHVHGYGGVDFADATIENLPTVTAALGKTGLPYCMATLVSLKEEKLSSALQAINEYVAKNPNPTSGVTQIVGVHLEGPFISESCKGAHDKDALRPEISMEAFLKIIKDAPLIKNWKITIDPSLPGALDFIRQSQALNTDDFSVKVFIGHCNPSEEIISQAIAAGAAGFTHLGNACAEGSCRKHGVVSSNLTTWVLKHPDKCPAGVELIVDGKHLYEHYVKLITRAIPGKTVLITDALGASGLKDGLYFLGELPIIKEGEAFYLADPTNTNQFLLDAQGERKLAGSAATLGTISKQYAKWLDGSVEENFLALYHATVKNPRASGLGSKMNLPDQNNFVVINKKGALVISVCNGEVIKHKPIKQSSAMHRTFINNHSTPTPVECGESYRLRHS